MSTTITSITCNFFHAGCIHATARKLVKMISTVELTPMNDGNVVLLGIPREHWGILAEENPSAAESGIFCVTRAENEYVFVAPVDHGPTPRVIDDAEQAEMVRRREAGQLTHRQPV